MKSLRACLAGIIRALTLLIVAGMARPLLGGTLITTNLPPNTAIINIDSRADGAAAYNGNQSLWYQPFNTSGSLLEYTLPAGTYGFRVVNPEDAAALFPALTSTQTNQIYTAWTYNTPWILNYLVFEGSAATNSSVAQLFDGDPEWPPYSNATDAYNGSVAHGTYNQIRAGPLGRSGTNFVYAYTFTNATTLIFVVPDYGLYDNGGGVSVLVTPVSPTGPLLKILKGNSTVTLLWPTNASGYNLEQTTASPSTNWGTVTNTPLLSNTNAAVTLPVDSSSHFFRLRHQ
jgi:hypothetical protein